MRDKGKNTVVSVGIKHYGHRMTKPREAIMQVLEKSTNHPCAEDIYLAVHKFYPNIGLTTVYRNLEFLVNLGVVSKFNFGDSTAKYELSEEYNKVGHHHHLVCNECSAIIDYSDFQDEELEYIKIAEKGISKRHNFKITNHIIQFSGVCKKCLEK